LSIDALRDRRDYRTIWVALDGEGYEAAPDPREISHDLVEFEHRDMFGSALTIGYNFNDGYNIKSITAFRRVKNWGSLDEDLSPQPHNVGLDISEDKHFTQEIRLTSPSWKNFNFVSGLFYFYQKSDQIFGVESSPEAPLSNFYLRSQGPVTTHSIAGYFHSNYHLGSNFTIFGGIRYTYEYKTITWSQSHSIDNFPPIYIEIENYTDDYSKGVFSPQIGVQHQPQDQLMFYGKTSWGYKSGGFGNHTVVKLEHIKLKPEYVFSVEGGIKVATIKNDLTLNTSVFFSKFDDYQSEVWLPISVLTLPVYTNAAEVTSNGFELEIIANPSRNLSLVASYGYVDARYDKFNFEGMAYDFTGNKLELAPEIEYSFSIEYHLPIINFGTFSIRGDYIHKDAFYSDASYSQDVRVPEYELINSKIAFENISGSIGIYAWVKNLSDNLYVLLRGTSPNRTRFTWYAIPRTFGIGLTYNFL
jgi:iron complex outermembrane receptor protein